MKYINQCTTIQSLYDYERSLDLSYNKTFLKSKLKSGDNDIIVNTVSLCNKYYDYILTTLVTVTLKDKELIKYKFQPKKFCADYYNTTELWGLLLKVNNFNSIVEFNSNVFKCFNSKIFNVLNEIFINEKYNIDKNEEDLLL